LRSLAAHSPGLTWKRQRQLRLAESPGAGRWKPAAVAVSQGTVPTAGGIEILLALLLVDLTVTRIRSPPGARWPANQRS
jgi:hypothetical protein